MNNYIKVKNVNKYLYAFIALFVIPLSGLSVDIYVPSLPAVGHYFHADKSLVQLTITSYMVGLGLMQLFAGAISDSFGRKKPMLMAMLVYMVTTIGIVLISNIHQLLLLRFIQGMMIGILMVPVRSVIPDLFAGRDLYKMITYMTIAWSIGPIVAPAIGGYLQQHFGWQANFYFLVLYSTVSFGLLALLLPETSMHRHPFQIAPIFKRYQAMLTHRDFMTGILINGTLYSMIILFAVLGPFLIQDTLHYSAIQFGRVALLIGLAWLLGGLTNRLMINVALVTKEKICFWSMLVVSGVMLLIAFLLPLNIYNIIIPSMLLMWLGGIVFPNYFARAIALFPTATGSANALFSAFVFLITGASSGLATFLKSTNQISWSLACLTMIGFCLLVSQLNNLFPAKETVGVCASS